MLQSGSQPSTFHTNEFFDFCLDQVPYFPDFLHLFFMSSGQCGRVGKTPVNFLGYAGKYWAAFTVGPAAYCDNTSEQFAALREGKNAFGPTSGYINPGFFHGLHYKRIQASGIQPPRFAPRTCRRPGDLKMPRPFGCARCCERKQHPYLISAHAALLLVLWRKIAAV